MIRLTAAALAAAALAASAADPDRARAVAGARAAARAQPQRGRGGHRRVRRLVLRTDGSVSLLVGYFNRNLKQVLDIPVGPNNRIEPGGPDFGQPTHFLPRRQWAVFTIPVPKDFGDKKLTWTLIANGMTTSIPLSVHKQYQVEPYEEKGMGNTPPMLRFEPGGAVHTGRRSASRPR